MNYGNTRRVEDPRLSQRTGGLSGPDLFPATLANLRRTRARFGDALEIIATGGVDAPDKALALLRGGRHRRRLLHGLRHPRPHPRAPDPRGPPRRPPVRLSGASAPTTPPPCRRSRARPARARLVGPRGRPRRGRVGCPQVVHLSTTVHTARIRPLWRALAGAAPQKRRCHRPPQVDGRKSAMARGRAPREPRRARI